MVDFVKNITDNSRSSIFFKDVIVNIKFSRN